MGRKYPIIVVVMQAVYAHYLNIQKACLRKRKEFTLPPLSEISSVNLTMYIRKHVEHVCRSRGILGVVQNHKIDQNCRGSRQFYMSEHSYLILKEAAFQQRCDLLKVILFPEDLCLHVPLSRGASPGLSILHSTSVTFSCFNFLHSTYHQLTY